MGLFALFPHLLKRFNRLNETPKKTITDINGLRSTRFSGQKFIGGLPNRAPTLNIDHSEIRQNVRTLSHTSLQMRALIERDIDTVIAQGLNLSPEPKYKILNIPPEKIKDWGSDVKTRFELWAIDRRSSRNGMYNLFQAQRLMQKSLDRDGELFIMLSYHNDPSLISPLRITILDPDQIRDDAYTWTGNGSTLKYLNNDEGITRNADGEETSYKVWTRDNNCIETKTVIPRVGRSGRIMMLHAIAGQDYAGQLRGISPLAICVQDLENILDFTMAQVQKAINQSNIAFTTESESDEPAIDPLANVQPGFGPAAVAFGNTPSPPVGAGNVTEESLEPVYTTVQHTTVTRPGSIGVFSLPGKQKLKPFPDTSPSSAFNVFVDSYFAYIAAATGRSVEQILMRFSSNYSASRATLILTWRIAEQRRWELDYFILSPIYEMWLSEEIAAGRISAPGWLDPRFKAAWIAHRFNGLSMPNIDPTVTAKAAKDYLSMGATTLEDVAIEYNDSDAESNRVKLRQEIDELRGIGPMPWENKSGDAPNNNGNNQGGSNNDMNNGENKNTNDLA